MARYLASAGGDEEAALDLYEWNTAASAAFFASLSWVEVALRNALSDTLEHWCEDFDGHWYDDPRGVFNGQTLGAIARARSKSRRSGRESPGRVIAELSFGFWRFLLTGAYQSTLWTPCLRDLFPGTKREHIEHLVATLYILRNRIAHHEPIYERDLTKDYNSLIALAERLHPRLAWLIDSGSGVPEVLERPPRMLALVAASGAGRV